MLSEEYYKTKWLPTQLRLDTTWTVHLNLKLVEVFHYSKLYKITSCLFQESDADSQRNIFTERSAKNSKKKNKKNGKMKIKNK